MQNEVSFSNSESTSNSLIALEKLFALNATSRQSLRCYADSWIGRTPTLARSHDRPCVYAFRVPGIDVIKIGSTRNPVTRRSGILNVCRNTYGWSRSDCKGGHYSHLEPASSLEKARAIESYAIGVLGKNRRAISEGTRRRQADWFAVPSHIASGAIVLGWIAVEAGISTNETNELFEKLYWYGL